MTRLQHPPVVCLGLDVAKDSIVISDGEQVSSIANNRHAIRSYLKSYNTGLAVCEPTGGFECIAIEECMRAGLSVHRADTLKLKAFIRSFGTLGKSDAIDAIKLAAYGRERWAVLALWSPQEPYIERLRNLVRRRSELVTMKVAEQNRANAPGAQEIAASFKAVMTTIIRQIEAIETAIDKLLECNAALQERIAICTQMNGIGRRTAASLIAVMPELGSLDRRQAASLAGVAPHPNESGKSKGYRKTKGGRPEVASILFMPALRAANAKGEFAGFYKRLVKAGKRPMTAITAVIRKIVITLNARIRDALVLQS